MAANNEIDIRIKVDDQGAITILDNVGNEIQKLEGKAAKTHSVIGEFQGGVIALNQALELAGKAFAVVSSAAGAAIEALERGSAVDDVTEAFGKLNEKAGTVADTFLNQLNQATDDTITNFDLMQKANETMRAGIKPDEFLELTKAARVLAETTGTDLKTAINEVSSAFETGRVRALKNSLGIIDVEKAENKLAATLGITREALSAEGKVMAARQAILEAAKTTTAEFGVISKDAGDRLATLAKVVTDTKDEFYKEIAANEGVNKALDELAQTLKEVDLKPLVEGIAAVITVAVEGATVITKLATATGVLGDIVKQFTMNPITAGLRGAADLFGEATKKTDTYKTKVFDTSKGINDLASWMDKHAEAQKRSAAATGKSKDGLIDHAAAAKKGADAAKDLATYMEGVSRAVSEATGVDKFPQLTRDIEEAFAQENVIGAEGVAKALEEIGRQAERQKIPLEDFKKHLDEIRDRPLFGPGNLEGEKEFQDALKRQAADVAKTYDDMTDSIKSSLGKGLGDAIGAALSGDSAGIKDSLRGTGSSIGGAAGSYYGNLVGGPFGAALGESLGSQVGDAIGKGVYDAVHHVFSSEDAGTKARKEADKFFADMFEVNRLSVIINGQLTQINDLVFGSGSTFGDGTAFDIFKDMPAQAQAAFSGVGTAFEQLLGLGTDMSGQLAAVFANNVGGSLNNLQLLVQATGKSFEDLKGSVVQAFLDGKLSALEAQGAIGQLQEVMTKGIPGAVGAVEQAFNNLKDAGKKGGRALVDALGDVGSEAKELGLKTLPDVQRFLANTGKFSADEIQKVMDALAKDGITSVEQLANATTEQLLPVLADLEVTNFPFAEAAKDVQGLIDQVNKLPAKIESDIVFNVKANYSDEGAKNIAAANLNLGRVGQSPGLPPV